MFDRTRINTKINVQKQLTAVEDPAPEKIYILAQKQRIKKVASIKEARNLKSAVTAVVALMKQRSSGDNTKTFLRISRKPRSKQKKLSETIAQC